ncbi:hypothetical protein Fmac_028376 [Flemingia macrophylla]|uniref:glucan endo-1,3-beta-D-glucosidase n=1 Tax=Flemingia macrophylla TaxID=520843 RepID=A0ABD1L7A9_9FABA
MEDNLLMHDDVANTITKAFSTSTSPSPSHSPESGVAATADRAPSSDNQKYDIAKRHRVVRAESDDLLLRPSTSPAGFTRVRGGPDNLALVGVRVATCSASSLPRTPTSVLQSSFSASSGSFKSELVELVIKLMLEFLRQTDSYLMLNAYPFFVYAANADKISLDYALLRDNPDVVDLDNDLKYSNLFNAQIDSIFAAMSTLKYDNVIVTVSDTGWPQLETLTRLEQSPRLQRELGEVCFEWE